MNKKEQLKRMREEKISSKEVYKGIILDIFVDQVRLPSGNTSQREVIRHCHAAAVLAIDENNRVLLEDQFRYPGSFTEPIFGRIIDQYKKFFIEISR